MWVLLNFLTALCLAYFVRRIFQRAENERSTIWNGVLLPNIVSAIIIFVVISIVRNWASQSNYNQHVPYTLILIVAAQIVWVSFDTVQLRSQQSSRRR